MPGPFDFLHIKGRTAGSSNELSFDVLDARSRENADQKTRDSRLRLPGSTHSSAPRIPRGPRAANQGSASSAAPLSSNANVPTHPASTPGSSKGSYHGVAGTATLSAVPEVERRKRARRARAVGRTVFLVVAAIVLASVGGFAGYRFYQDKLDFTSKVNTIINGFVQVDGTIVQVDAFMTNPLNAPERDARDQVLDSFPELEANLENIAAQSRELAKTTTLEADLTALGAAGNAARARGDMLAAAESAFKLSDIANRQAEAANQAWSKVLAGDASAREAAALANSATTEEATLQARAKTEEAIEFMKAGREQLAIVERGVTGLSLSGEIAYVDKRLESLEFALVTSDALLAGDREAATAANAAYNAADQDAVKMAAALPVSITDQVKDRYAPEVDAQLTAYAAARSAAIAADSTLRASYSLS